MNSLQFVRLCYNCHKEGVNYSKCSKCKVAHYCSRECQLNNWCTHKYTCNLTKNSHSKLTDHLNFVSTNTKFTYLLQSLTYHFCSTNDDQFLMCILSQDTLDDAYNCSFLVQSAEILRDRSTITTNSKLVWLIFKDDENNTSEGGIRIDIETCKKQYDIMANFVNFRKVNTITDTLISGANFEFTDNIKKDCRVLMNKDKCLFIYDENVTYSVA